MQVLVQDKLIAPNVSMGVSLKHDVAFAFNVKAKNRKYNREWYKNNNERTVMLAAPVRVAHRVAVVLRIVATALLTRVVTSGVKLLLLSRMMC